jgi:hypothetical protein
VSFEARLHELRGRIDAAARRARRDPLGVRLLAVTKTVPAERIAEALQAGVGAFGESRLQEAESKIAALDVLGAGQPLPAPSWHFIGRLQRNKARRAVELFDVIESVDRLELGRELEHAARERPQPCEVFLQVNLDREPQKAGVLPEHAAELASALGRECPHLRVTGLMAIPRVLADPAERRAAFAGLRELRDKLRTAPGGSALRELSMGMSDDFELAIEEGATWIRVGTALFGEPPR